VSLLDFVGSILHRERRRAYEMAVAAELPKLAPPKPSSEVMEEVRGRLAGPGALTFGRLPSGQIVRVKGDTSMKSALVIGAPGSGKTRFLLGLLIELISRALRDEVEIELVDPKTETYSLTCQILAALYLGGDLALRDAIRRRVRSSTGHAKPSPPSRPSTTQTASSRMPTWLTSGPTPRSRPARRPTRSR
jgi:FtsK/SpoIIIE family.